MDLLKRVGVGLTVSLASLFLFGANPYQKMRPFQDISEDEMASFKLYDDGKRELVQTISEWESSYSFFWDEEFKLLGIIPRISYVSVTDVDGDEVIDNVYFDGLYGKVTVYADEYPKFWQKCQEAFDDAHEAAEQNGFYYEVPVELLEHMKFSNF